MVDAALSVAPAHVPFLDLGPQHRPLQAQLLAEIDQLVESGAFTNGPAVAAFEDAFANYCGTAYCVGTASGLDALRIALTGLGVGPGDEVVVPALTFVATLEAVTQTGARPVLADVNDDDYTMDPDAARAAIGPKTRALMPVHLYGQLADVRALRALALTSDVALVEDACQAHGARRDGFRAGGVGDAAAFSFYPAKNLGAFGDAGALVTGDAGLVRAARSLREHGQVAKYSHEREGWTARLDTLQALVLLHKLPLLDDWNGQRRVAARYYSEVLEGVGDLTLPHVPPGSEPVYHLYEIRTVDPDDLAAFLRSRGITTGRHYPEPPHLTQAYGWLGHSPGAFPVAEALARELLSLPLYPGIAEEQLAAVVDAIGDYFRRGS